MNFSPRLLSAFLTLAHCRHFTLAATRVHMSQSAFSQAISRLEAQVGVRLFDRNTRSVSLTPEGEILLPVATRLMQEMGDVFQDLRDHADRKKGKVAIAALPGSSAQWLPRILADFQRHYPGIKVRLYDAHSDGILELLREGKVDFAINRETGHEREFDTRLLFNDKHYLVCRPDHPLAKNKSVALRQLAGYDYIHTVRSASLWQRLYPFLSRVAIRDTGHEIAYMSTAAGMIANGMGITVVAGQTLFNFKQIGLSAIPISDKDLSAGVYVLQRHGHAFSVAAHALLKLIETHETTPRLKKSAARARAL